jgi:hypothetical protein
MNETAELYEVKYKTTARNGNVTTKKAYVIGENTEEAKAKIKRMRRGVAIEILEVKKL